MIRSAVARRSLLGGAIMLLVAAGGLSLRWFGRLI